MTRLYGVFFLSCRIMQAVLDHTIPYLHVREAFGQKIGHFQVSGLLSQNVFFHWVKVFCKNEEVSQALVAHTCNPS
jgi:hypothetical protein